MFGYAQIKCTRDTFQRCLAFVYRFNLLLTHWKKTKKTSDKQHSLSHNSVAHLVLENSYNILVVKIYDIIELASEIIKEEGPEWFHNFEARAVSDYYY